MRLVKLLSVLPQHYPLSNHNKDIPFYGAILRYKTIQFNRAGEGCFDDEHFVAFNCVCRTLVML